MFDPKKLQQFSLASSLMPNKGFQKVGAMADKFGQIQQMKEAQGIQAARTGAAQMASDTLGSKPPIATSVKIDEMLNGIYPDGPDPSIREFYVDLLGKYGR